MVLLTKYSTEANKHVTVVNLPLMRFIGGPKNLGITGNIKGAQDTERLVAMIITVGVPVEEDMDDIEIKSKDMVIHLECE